MPRARLNYLTRDSGILLGTFFLAILLIVYIWWPLAEEYLAFVDWSGAWWLYVDWLLLGIFCFISLTIVARADLRADALIIFVGVCGGLAIEAWGTQTNLWFYYTDERPPLWIIPAWPIASLSIDRITRFMSWLIDRARERFGSVSPAARSSSFYSPFADFHALLSPLYWVTVAAFMGVMLLFVSPTFGRPYTIISALICIGLLLTHSDRRYTLLTFAAGSGLGYYLELWGTTRACWTYYTFQTPPLFAVLAHGMAAVAFWRAGLILKGIGRRARMSPITRQNHVLD